MNIDRIDAIPHGDLVILAKDLFQWAEQQGLTLIGGHEICYMDGNSEAFTIEGGEYIGQEEFIDVYLTKAMLHLYITSGGAVYVHKNRL